MQGGTKAFQKMANLSLVLRTIRLRKKISRIEIARTLGLDKSTITNIVSQLLDAGIINVVSEGESAVQGGRKPVFLGLNPGFGTVVGMEIQYNRCRSVLVNIDGSVHAKETIPFAIGTPIEEICSTVMEHMKEESRILGVPVIGAGIGFPGIVDPYKGIIVSSLSLQLLEYDFAAEIVPRFSIPLLIDNDSNCCAWGELVANRGKGPENFLYILPKFRTLEEEYDITGVVGIGVGTVIDGNVYYGNNYAAGEFKSVLWKQGNIEQVAMNSRDLLRIDSEERILRQLIHELCSNLSAVISILNPGRIYIGGDLGKHYDLVMEIISSDLKETYIAQKGNGCEIAPTDYDIYDVAVGGANMFLEKLFDIPHLRKTKGYYILDWNSFFDLQGEGELN